VTQVVSYADHEVLSMIWMKQWKIQIIKELQTNVSVS